MAERSLSPQETRFVNFLIKGLGKAESATAAGYSAANAGRIASGLLQRQRVKDALAEFYEHEAWQTKRDRELIRRRLLAMALAQASDLFDDNFGMLEKSEIPPDTLQLVISARTWDTPEQGSGSQVKCVNPIDAMKAYLKFFPEVADASAGLEDAAAEVESEWEAVMDRMTGDDEDDEADDEDDEADGGAS